MKRKHLILSLLALLSINPVQCATPPDKDAEPLALISVVRGGYGKTTPFDDIRFYDGKRRGLVDSTGKEIIPSVFAAIEYCGNGIYMVTETLPGHHYHYGSGKRLFNRDGVELSFKLPSGARLIRVFSLGVEADKDTSIILDQLPKETLLVCGTEYPLRQGLCDLNGHGLVPPVYYKMVYRRPAQGFFSVVQPGTGKTLCSSIDLQTRKIESVNSIPQSCGPRFSSSYTYQNPDKLPLAETKTVSYQLVEPDRLIKVVAPATELFDREYWSERQTCPIAVSDMFSRFLRQYNLVGMKEDQAFELLGPTSCVEAVGYAGELGSITYAFSGGGCESFPFGVKLYLRDGRVGSWALFSGKKESRRIFTNDGIESVQPIISSFTFPGVQYPMTPDNE